MVILRLLPASSRTVTCSPPAQPQPPYVFSRVVPSVLVVSAGRPFQSYVCVVPDQPAVSSPEGTHEELISVGFDRQASRPILSYCMRAAREPPTLPGRSSATARTFPIPFRNSP